MTRLHLAAGVDIVIDERPWRVSALNSGSVNLLALDHDGERACVPVEKLVSSSGLRHVRADAPTGPSRSALVEGLNDKALADAIWRRAHVMEILTGHPDGDWRSSDDPERPGYELTATPKGDRIALKAKELRAAGIEKVSERTIRRWVERYEDQGLLGLVDRRETQLAGDGPQPSPQVLEVLDELVARRTHRSTARTSNLFEDLKRELKRRYPDSRIVGLREVAEEPVLRVPKQAAFYKLVKTRYPGSHLTGEANTRVSEAERPTPALFPFRATRSGEVVQIDSTRLDLMALDRATGQVVRAELTLAVDAFDRCIRAVRVAAVGTRGVDVALMVYDMLCPVRWRPEWGPGCVWNYHGIPERLVIDLAGERLVAGRPAAAPFGQPQTIVCDRGKIYLSRTFFASCEEFGISIQPAPPKTPNYKGVVEQTFDTFNEQVLERLPGHTGRGAQHRGKAVLDDPLLFLDELEDLVLDWAVTVHHRRRHDGCRLPEAPQVAVTPNRMFEYSIARSGFITVPPAPERLVACLPSKRVILQAYGVNLDGLRYYHPVLDVWRARRSPYEPASGKPVHPIHYDPRDLSRVWFYDPDEDQWVAVMRRAAANPDVPFNDAALAWVKRLMTEDGVDRRDPDVLSEYLDGFLERQLSGGTLPQERKLIARMLDDARAARKVGEAVPPTLPECSDDGDEASDAKPRPLSPRRTSEPSVAPDSDDGPSQFDEFEDDIEPLPLVDDDSFAEAL